MTAPKTISPDRDGSRRATLALPVHPAGDLRVIHGVAEGEPLSFAEELVMDDVYGLAPGAERESLHLGITAAGEMSVAAGSALGTGGNGVHLDCCATFMDPDGVTLDVLVFVEVVDGGVEAVYAQPLVPLAEKRGYRLIGVDRQIARSRFAESAGLSFVAGTCITMATGQQVPVEDLAPGDRILTRDGGAQIVRWTGRSTVRAVGDAAPILIREGALNNARDLLVSPDHRLFVYQRTDAVGAGRSEVLVKARHLVDGHAIVQTEGGFVDYCQVLLDAHHLIYAEGIAAESLLLDPRRAAEFGGPAQQAGPHAAFEIERPGPGAAAALKRASEGDGGASSS